MSRLYDVMVAGHLCLDLFPSFLDTEATQIRDIMRPGKLINVGAITISTGGLVSNTGISMRRLGNKVCFCANVGDDDLGQLTLNLMNRNGDTQGIRVISGHASSYTIIIAPPNIDRIFLHNPETNNKFGAENLNADQLLQCRLFHFGYPSLMRRMFENDGKELQKIFQTAKDAGVTTSCDMALPDPDSDAGKVNWPIILENFLPYVDIFMPSFEEMFYALYPDKFLKLKKEHDNAELTDILSTREYSKLADEVLEMGPKILALKAGKKGAYVKTNSMSYFNQMGAVPPKNFDNWSCRELWTPAFAVEGFRNANGTGDAFIAGFLTAYLQGSTIECALKVASCCGMQIAQSDDTTSGICSWDQTLDFAKRKLPLLDLSVNIEGWTWSEKHIMWAGPKDPLSYI